MTLERKNPIPVGVYWIDSFNARPEGQIPRLGQWLKKNSSTVKVLKVRKAFPASGIDIDRKTHFWTLFEITKPTKRWPLTLKIGAPTKANEGKKTKVEDTDKREEVWHPVKAITEFFGSVSEFKAGFVGGGSIALLAVLFLLLKSRR